MEIALLLITSLALVTRQMLQEVRLAPIAVEDDRGFHVVRDEE